jgi:hypothetical protein
MRHAAASMSCMTSTCSPSPRPAAIACTTCSASTPAPSPPPTTLQTSHAATNRLLDYYLHTALAASQHIADWATSSGSRRRPVAAIGRPRLVIFLTVVSQSCPHPFCKLGQAAAVPLLQRVTAERLTCAVTLICQNSQLVHQVRMLRPDGEMTSATSQTCSWFNQLTTASNHDQTSLRS